MRRPVLRRYLPQAALRIGLAIVCAAVFYAGWLATVLAIGGAGGAVARIVLWVLAPVVTAVGFAVGFVAADRLMRIGGTGFSRVVLWPLTGCAIGAGAVYWFGPMLIVFGMFVGGIAGLVAREALSVRKASRNQTGTGGAQDRGIDRRG